MALSEGEQRRLDEIAAGLTLEDPTFAQRITDAGLRRPRIIVAIAVFVMGMVAVVVVGDAAPNLEAAKAVKNPGKAGKLFTELLGGL